MLQYSLISFKCKLDCIISKFKAKAECLDLSFEKLCQIKHLCMKPKQQTGWMKTQIHSLTAGGAWNSSNRIFPALLNITIISLYEGKIKIKYHLNISKDSRIPSEIYSYKRPPQFSIYSNILYIGKWACSACYSIFSFCIRLQHLWLLLMAIYSWFICPGKELVACY